MSEVAAGRPGLQLSKRDPDPPVRVPNLPWQDTDPWSFCKSIFLKLDKYLNWLFSAISLHGWFHKRPHPQCLSALQQQPMFRACCPVSVLGGVIRPSASHWHERFMFILDQSVCLFMKGFDQSTPWPPGSSYPPAEVIRFTLCHANSSVFICLFWIVPPSLCPTLVSSLTPCL